MKPAVEVEGWNHRFANAGLVRYLERGSTQRFRDRKSDGSPHERPQAGELKHFTYAGRKFLSDNVEPALQAFARFMFQQVDSHRELDDLLIIRDAFRRFGVDLDREGCWDENVADIRDYVDARKGVPPAEG